MQAGHGGRGRGLESAVIHFEDSFGTDYPLQIREDDP